MLKNMMIELSSHLNSQATLLTVHAHSPMNVYNVDLKNQLR